jgi:hypothetical protein
MIDPKFLCLVSGLAAGAVRTLKGWLESKDPFNPRLFCYTLLRTTMQGAAVGYGLNQEPVSAFFQVFFADTLFTNKAMDKIGEKVGAKTS